MGELPTREEVKAVCESLLRLSKENTVCTPYGECEIMTYELAAEYLELLAEAVAPKGEG